MRPPSRFGWFGWFHTILITGGNKQIIMAFHDHYSSLNKSYLLKSEKECPDTLDAFCDFAGACGHTVKRFHTDKVSQNKQLEQNCYHIVSVLVCYLVFCPVGDKQEVLEERRKR